MRERRIAIRNAQAGAANQTADINGAYAVTQQRDAANIYQSTGSGEAADMYRTMLQNWSDMTANIAQAMVRAADSLNDDLAKLITGQGKKGDFGKTLTQAGGSLKDRAAGYRGARSQGARPGRQGRQAGWYEGQSDLHVHHHRGRHYSWRRPGTDKRRRTAGFVGKGANGLFGSGGDGGTLASYARSARPRRIGGSCRHGRRSRLERQCRWCRRVVGWAAKGCRPAQWPLRRARSVAGGVPGTPRTLRSLFCPC